jgi:hypothetical protein
MPYPHHFPFPQRAPGFRLKAWIDPATNRKFNIVSLPQKDSSYVASVVEAPTILVYDNSRESAEEEASKKFLQIRDRHAYRNHPLARTKAVNIDMEFDPRLDRINGSQPQEDPTQRLKFGSAKAPCRNALSGKVPKARLSGRSD